MRKLYLAILATLVFAFTHVSGAQAATATCTPYNGGSGFPGAGYVQYCGDGSANSPTSAQAGYVYSALQGAHGLTTVTKLRGTTSTSLEQWFVSEKASNAKLGTFYLFKDQATFYAWAAVNMVGISHPTAGTDPISASADGFSEPAGTGVYTGQGPYLYTVIFTTLSNGTPNLVYVTTTEHEIGHYMDWLFAYTVTGGTTKDIAQSTQWTQTLNADWKTFIALSPVQKNQCTLNGNPGIFAGFADDNNIGTAKGYICNGNAGTGPALNNAYAGNNQQALQKAWTYTFGMENGTQPQELLSEEYAQAVNGAYDFANAPWTEWYYFQYFPCSVNFISFVVQKNALPTSSNIAGTTYPNTCPLF
jgi:hypothetical protein